MKLEAGEPEYVVIVLGCQEDLPRSFADDLATIVRREMQDESVQVDVWCLQNAWKDESQSQDPQSAPQTIGKLAVGEN